MSLPQMLARGVSLGTIVGREVTGDLLRHLTPWSADRAVPFLAVTLASTVPVARPRAVGQGSA